VSDLATLQREFQAHVLGGDTAFLARIADRGAPATVAHRAFVYFNAYRRRLVEVLQNDFPGVRALAGEDGFEALAAGYIDACPSRHPSLRHFGGRFADYLRADAVASARPELADMAAFEWLFNACFDAADATPIGVDAIAALAPERWLDLRFRFLPGLRRLGLRTNAPGIWKAVKAGEPPPPADAGAERPWVLWRSGFDVSWRPLEADEAVALDAALAGATFPDLCEALFAHAADEQAVPLRAATLVKRWVADCMLAGVDAAPAFS
jgi:hypothetical protein